MLILTVLLYDMHTKAKAARTVFPDTLVGMSGIDPATQNN
jgi:hypothetical protein